MKEISPYKLKERKSFEKDLPQAYHDRLKGKRYDIALEVAWKTEAATALNPCIENYLQENLFGKEGEYSGYNKRWLMFPVEDKHGVANKNKIAISPFTVKSAIANGFAAIMGGCLRVSDKITKHSDNIDGYPYNGAWKRYRVARDGSSKPGIIEERVDNPDGSRYLKIRQVKELYYDTPLPGGHSWKRGDTAYISNMQDRGRFKPPIITPSGLSKEKVNPTDTEVQYYGPCEPDMYTNYKHHQYRFIKKLATVSEGVLRKEHFYTDEKDLKKIVYAGVYKKEKDNPKPWFQDLSKIGKDDFVYYEEFAGKLSSIGKNFLFKGLFYHPDTVPEGSEACTNKNQLCPRCAMFGMTDQNEKEKDAVGLRGRFKSATLICHDILEKEQKPESKPVPVWEGESTNKRLVYKNVSFELWRHQGEEVGCQLLLPILASPKPNKLDVDSYFNRQTGKAKGAKSYEHGKMSYADLKNLIAETDKGKESQIADYAHQLRTCAQVFEEGLVFEGVVGAENCSISEIAALVAILDSNTLGHGCKVGLGKSLGMGSIRSSIGTIWLRQPKDYSWQPTSLKNIEEFIPGMSEEIKTLMKVQDKLNLMEKGWDERKLCFSLAGTGYWPDFFNPAGPRAGQSRGRNNRGGSPTPGRSSSGGTQGEVRSAMRIIPAKPEKR